MASACVTKTNLEKKTVEALNLKPGEFRITHKHGGVVERDYRVETKDGRVFHCVIDGIPPTTSDALCEALASKDDIISDNLDTVWVEDSKQPQKPVAAKVVKSPTPAAVREIPEELTVDPSRF